MYPNGTRVMKVCIEVFLYILFESLFLQYLIFLFFFKLFVLIIFTKTYETYHNIYKYILLF
jgi:hypothetical protein